MQGQYKSALCRAENRQSRFRFAGYAASGAENTVRPRAFYRACVSCSSLVLTLADVDDAMALCRTVLAEWMRRGGRFADRIDGENVLGDMYAHVWHLYNQWNPSGLTFTSYATGILRRKVNTFVSLDVGDPKDSARLQKAHSRTTSVSYEGATGDSGGLEFAYGASALDGTGDHVASRGWIAAVRDSGGHGVDTG